MKKLYNILFGISIVITTNTGNALPAGGKVISGDVNIDTNGNNMFVNQDTNKAIIDWRGFDISGNERVDFFQPNSNSITLNRITGGDISHIHGQLNANGKLFLVNSNGIVFGKNSQVNVAGLLATTSQITNNDFNTGNYKFSNTNTDAKIINNGSISIKDAGFAALVSPMVANNGLINAKLSKITLGSADAFTLDMYGDKLIQFDVSKQVENGLVSNTGKILADAGIITLSAESVAGVVEDVINTSGVIEAKSVGVKDGVIILSGNKNGKVLVRGDLSAKSVKVLGDKVGLLNGANINTGGAGEVLIGGNFQGKGVEQNANYTYIDKNAKINADGVNSDGGRVIVWADKNTQFYGEISATGSDGKNGGFAEVSGKQNLVFRGKVDLTAKNGNKGTLLLDPKNIIIADGGTDVVADNDIFNENPNLDATFDADLITTALDGANLVLQANNDITVNEAIDSSSGGGGNLSLSAGRSIIVNEDITLFGGFNATVNDENAITAHRDAGDASFTLASGKTISTTKGDNNIIIDYENGANGNDATGAMSIAGLLNAGNGDILLDTTANDGGSASREMITSNGVAGANIIARDLGINGEAVILSQLQLQNNLSINTTGNVAQLNAWSVNKDTNISAANQNVNLSNASNNFSQVVSIDAQDVTLNNNSALLLGTSNITGNADITANGISDAGIITANGVGKSFTVNSTNGVVSLDSFNHDFTTIQGSSTWGWDFKVKDANALDIGALTVGKDAKFEIGGDLTQSGAISNSNTGNIFEVNAGGNNITLDNTANDFAIVKLVANDVALTDASAIIFGDTTIAGNATINAGGGVDDSGTIIANGVNKTFQINNAGQDVELDSANNDFTKIGFNSFNVDLTDVNSVDIATSNITGNTTINASGSVSGDVINATGDFSVNATGNIVLVESNNDFNTISLNGSNVYVDDKDNLDLAASNITGEAEFTTGGDLTQSGILSIDGKTTINAAGFDVVLDNTQNTQKFAGGVEVYGSNVEISSGNQADFAIQGNISGNLQINSEGSISDSGNLIVAGDASFVEEANDKSINLNTLQATGKVTLVTGNNGNAIVNNGNLDLEITGIVSNDLTLITTGNIFNNTNNHLQVGGDAVLQAQNITLDNINNDFVGSVGISANNALITDKNTLKFDTSNFSGFLTANAVGIDIIGDITTNGNIDINANITLGGNLLSNGGNISLTNVSFLGGAKTINSDDGDISFTKITGTDDSRLRLLAGGENAVTPNGGTINGEIDVSELFISGFGGALTGKLRSVTPNNGRKAAESIGTSPVPHGGDFTFNGYRVTGKAVEGESRQRFVTPIIPKISSNSKDTLFVVANNSTKYHPMQLDLTESGVNLFGNKQEKEENDKNN
jgi:filamentous hemagglutinin family protein